MKIIHQISHFGKSRRFVSISPLHMFDETRQVIRASWHMLLFDILVYVGQGMSQALIPLFFLNIGISDTLTGFLYGVIRVAPIFTGFSIAQTISRIGYVKSIKNAATVTLLFTIAMVVISALYEVTAPSKVHVPDVVVEDSLLQLDSITPIATQPPTHGHDFSIRAYAAAIALSIGSIGYQSAVNNGHLVPRHAIVGSLVPTPQHGTVFSLLGGASRIGGAIGPVVAAAALTVSFSCGFISLVIASAVTAVTIFGLLGEGGVVRKDGCAGVPLLAAVVAAAPRVSKRRHGASKADPAASDPEAHGDAFDDGDGGLLELQGSELCVDNGSFCIGNHQPDPHCDEPAGTADGQPISAPAKPHAEGASLMATLRVYGPVLASLLIYSFCVAYPRIARNLIVSILGTRAGLSASTVSLYLGISSFVDMAVFPSSAIWLSMGRRVCAHMTGVGMGLSFIVLAMSTTSNMLLLSCILLGASIGAGSGILLVIAADGAPQCQSTRPQFFAMMRWNILGEFVASAASGWIAESGPGAAAASYIAAAMAFASCLWFELAIRNPDFLRGLAIKPPAEYLVRD